MSLTELRQKPHLSASSIGDYVECGLLYKFGRTKCNAAFYLGNNISIHSHIQYGVVEFDVEDIKMKKHFNTIMRWNGEK